MASKYTVHLKNGQTLTGLTLLGTHFDETLQRWHMLYENGNVVYPCVVNTESLEVLKVDVSAQ